MTEPNKTVLCYRFDLDNGIFHVIHIVAASNDSRDVRIQNGLNVITNRNLLHSVELVQTYEKGFVTFRRERDQFLSQENPSRAVLVLLILQSTKVSNIPNGRNSVK